MMHLTQALIPYEVAARLKLHNAYDWHRLAWDTFPGRPEAERDFLTRIERQEREGRFRLLILSASRPQRPAPLSEASVEWQTRTISEKFLGYAAYRFTLRANPTKRDNKLRKRVPLLEGDAQREWLNRKAKAAGFRVIAESLRIIPEGRQRFRDRTQGKAGVHHSVEFAGTLIVEDAESFKVSFERGIGSGKAFGFGLLALVPCASPEETQ
ncbi:MAG: type I-E CRISPR-associated protein Cas6/Cse3/CasE [Kiritimatiellae bacterium]|nr:type I-E CRISPR-associated protein Cas6/Cse3/CasE [Kiritimatiellia bacterium]